VNTQTQESLEQAYRSVMVLIPAYNGGSAVGQVVRGTRAVSAALSILVVDDGSTDTTAQAALEAGAVVVSHPQNLGKGAALRTGFEHFLAADLGAVVTLDADGQHSPAEIPALVGRWLATRADIVIGTRRRRAGRMPRLRVITNTLSSLLVSLSAGKYIHDSQSGYRLLSRRVVREVKTSSRGYGAESEILIRAVAAGFTVVPAPISTIYRGEKSYIHPLKQPLLFLGLILKSFFWRFERVGRRQTR
jgi:glycosyltransferase involved in cell wall biosynthesis